MEVPNFTELSIAQVAGLIAVGLFTVQLLLSFTWPLILVAILNEKETAVTWSVVARVLHTSHWPVVLRTDSAASKGVRRRVSSIVWAILLTTVLLAVTAIITPLGLYEDIVPNKSTTLTTFHYVRDASALGLGTLPRPDTGFSRVCRGGLVACPNTDQEVIMFNESVPDTNFTRLAAEAPFGYDTRVPKRLVDYLSSGISQLNQTVSSPFDIQWRTWRLSPNDTTSSGTSNSSYYNNGSLYAIGAYRPIASLILSDDWSAVEGLIVDTKSGGVGFRNHSVPLPFLPYGGRWSEDLLFIEPVTECVNLNISFDFTLVQTFSTLYAGRPRLVDHGGFVDISKKTVPIRKIGNQTDPRIHERAYNAAWAANVLLMLLFNITDLGPRGFQSDLPFSYLNSSRGNEILLPTPDSEQSLSFSSFNSLHIFNDFNNLVSMLASSTTVPLDNDITLSNITSVVDRNLPSNPFKLIQQNFTTIQSLCDGLYDDTPPIFGPVGGLCGALLGIPRQKQNMDSVVFEPGAEWTTPLYSCASANRATIKTVEFRYNSSVTLDGLSVVKVEPKTYPDYAKQPLWAVETSENSGFTWLRHIDLLWGLVEKEDTSFRNFSYIRAPQLWLNADVHFAGIDLLAQNLPATDFPARVLNTLYTTGFGATSDTVGDYTGALNLPLSTKWKNLTSTSSGAARAVNLIWTDLAANAVVGTKGWIPSGPPPNLSKRIEAEVSVPIFQLGRKVQYHIAYAIPAFIVLTLTVATLLVSLFAMYLGRATFSRLRTDLIRTSTGRVMTSFLVEKNVDEDKPISTSRWLQRQGRVVVDVSTTLPHRTGPSTVEDLRGQPIKPEEKQRLQERDSPASAHT